MHRKFHQNIIFSVHHTRKRETNKVNFEITKKFIARLNESQDKNSQKSENSVNNKSETFTEMANISASQNDRS
jgi:hypothetical protein